MVPGDRLRYWCSFRYLRIPPLHLKFHLPLPYSRSAVLKAGPGLSPGIKLLTYRPAYAPFTPSDSEQRSPPTYYRGCWHVVSRGFLERYRQAPRLTELFFPLNRALQSEDRHHSRGVAASDFRPLRKIPYCCLPKESGPYLSPNVAVHPLRPATHQSLGGLLLRQLANGPQAHLQAKTLLPSLIRQSCDHRTTSGISPALARLSRT